ncbi:hypothetical protein O181_091572 [Austropuccinia psidii MF-1]|uniref:Reverse transcriptase Ty1/copia-type domain-containing protein n=1 Tax=Austropuccinia psidii MF-1 TaxID=1389203 RepID=A0A9Q3P8S4_9BASI|nr:hypothetical protein [Austropuccinia psidii MF-1]
MEVWTAVDRVPGMKVIKTRFVFDIKQKPSLDDITYKARLVARGFCQRYGIDCEHTYAPTASLSSLQLLFAMATKFRWSISGFDISVAYLHSKLEEEIYVDAPVKFRPEWRGKAMKLNKAMYGLKQAGRLKWEDKITRIVGIDVVQTPKTLKLSQSKFAGQIVEQFEHKSNTTFLRTSTVLPESKLQKSTNAPIEQKLYQSVIGLFNYLALVTRPDLSFAVGYLACYAGVGTAFVVG